MKYKRRRLYLLIGAVVLALFLVIVNMKTEMPSESIATEIEDPYYFEEYEQDLKDGVYRSTNRGFVDDITVEMEVENGMITRFQVIDHNETSQISKRALTDIPYEVLQKNSAKVDILSGATQTSEGIIQGAKDCIRQAGGNPEDL